MLKFLLQRDILTNRKAELEAELARVNEQLDQLEVAHGNELRLGDESMQICQANNVQPVDIALILAPELGKAERKATSTQNDVADQIKALCKKARVKPLEVALMLAPQFSVSDFKTARASSGPKLSELVFRNPYNGEELRTRGYNNNTLKRWKALYGDNIVKDWLVT
ncbi:hypothetical protein ACYPKM_03290 [Pseudomonas aeruginosa]